MKTRWLSLVAVQDSVHWEIDCLCKYVPHKPSAGAGVFILSVKLPKKRVDMIYLSLTHTDTEKKKNWTESVIHQACTPKLSRVGVEWKKHAKIQPLPYRQEMISAGIDQQNLKNNNNNN